MEIDEKPLRRSIRIMNIRNRQALNKANDAVFIKLPKKAKKLRINYKNCFCCTHPTICPKIYKKQLHKNSLEAALEKLSMNS